MRIGWTKLGRELSLALFIIIAATPMTMFGQVHDVLAGTTCSLTFDWSEQWTTVHNDGFMHPGSGCPQNDSYGGWAGIDGAITTPSHFPNLQGNNNNHSLGWLNVQFGTPWLQIGWQAGCIGKSGIESCYTSPNIGLYDEEQFPDGNYFVNPDGVLSYSTTDIYRIEYYPSVSEWEIFDGYNHLLEAVSGFPSSGTPSIGSEAYNGNTQGHAVEMPVTVFGSSNPNTNSGLRIKGANGYVVWSNSLSSYYTSHYDESNCPTPTWCSSGSPDYAVPYYLYLYDYNYYMYAYGG